MICLCFRLCTLQQTAVTLSLSDLCILNSVYIYHSSPVFSQKKSLDMYAILLFSCPFKTPLSFFFYLSLEANPRLRKKSKKVVCPNLFLVNIFVLPYYLPVTFILSKRLFGIAIGKVKIYFIHDYYLLLLLVCWWKAWFGLCVHILVQADTSFVTPLLGGFFLIPKEISLQLNSVYIAVFFFC